MAKLTLNDITGGYQTATAFNANNALIEAALENTLSRDGTAPNNMLADLDLNSNNLNNVNNLNMSGDIAGVDLITATSIVVNALTLNGEAVTTTTTLAGGLAASEITYDSAALSTKLDNEFLQTTGNWDMAGTLDVTGLLTADAGVTAGGDVNVTGDIVVSGTVDGIDIATLDASVTTLDTEAIKYTDEFTGHVRAGNMQFRNGDGNHYQFFPSSQAADNWFSVGPTGSGADATWANLDLAEMPVNTKAIMVQVAWSAFVTAADTLADLELYATAGPENNEQSSKGVDRNQVFDWRGEAEVDTNMMAGGQSGVIFIPLDANRWFRLRWEETNLTSPSMVFRLIGFVTE